MKLANLLLCAALAMFGLGGYFVLDYLNAPASEEKHAYAARDLSYRNRMVMEVATVTPTTVQETYPLSESNDSTDSTDLQNELVDAANDGEELANDNGHDP